MRQSINLTFENEKKYSFCEIGEKIDISNLLLMHLTDKYAAVKVKTKKVLTGIALFDNKANEVKKENTYLIINKEKGTTEALTDMKPLCGTCGGVLLNIEHVDNAYYLTVIDYHNNMWYVILNNAFDQITNDDIINEFSSSNSDALSIINKISCRFEHSDFRCSNMSIMKIGGTVVKFNSRTPLCTQLTIVQDDKEFFLFNDNLKPFVNENNEVMTSFIYEMPLFSTVTVDFIVNKRHFRAVKKYDKKTDPIKSFNVVKTQFLKHGAEKALGNLIKNSDWHVTELNYTKII